MRIIRLFVPIDKLAATVSFYAEGLGLKQAPTESGGYFFRVGCQTVELVQVDGPLRHRNPHVSFHVHGLRECIKCLVQARHLPKSTLLEPDKQGRVQISDPGGNIIILVEAEK